jgi:hypothetical protein
MSDMQFREVRKRSNKSESEKARKRLIQNQVFDGVEFAEHERGRKPTVPQQFWDCQPCKQRCGICHFDSMPSFFMRLRRVEAPASLIV